MRNVLPSYVTESSLQLCEARGVEQSSEEQDLLSTQYKTGSLYTLYIHNHFTIISLKRRYYPHFTDGKTESQKD